MIGMAHFKKWEQWSYLVFGESRTSKKGETMRFYRGITVPIRSAPAVIDQIRTRGLLPGDGNWRMSAADLKGRLEEIWRKPKVTYADTKPTEGNPGPSWVCACAEEQGAVYYACRHDKSGENDTPILISFDAEASDAVVDGRDFLYTAFQLSDAARGRTVLEQLFGPAILRYADRAWGVDGDERIALCDLAVQDNAVVLAHADNKTVIAGRFGTLLRSAFFVRTPVPAARIADVRVVEDAYELPEPDIVLGGLIRQGRPDAADAGLSDAGLAPARAYRDTTCGSYRQDRRACVAFSGPFREAVFIFDPCRFPVRSRMPGLRPLARIAILPAVHIGRIAALALLSPGRFGRRSSSSIPVGFRSDLGCRACARSRVSRYYLRFISAGSPRLRCFLRAVSGGGLHLRSLSVSGR